MPIEPPTSDLSRSILHEPDHDWPETVKIQLLWRDRHYRPVVRTINISANQFFGRGSYGAPLDGASLINSIEILRRMGPPIIKRGKGKA